jgi:hypothetical protein
MGIGTAITLTTGMDTDRITARLMAIDPLVITGMIIRAIGMAGTIIGGITGAIDGAIIDNSLSSKLLKT